MSGAEQSASGVRRFAPTPEQSAIVSATHAGTSLMVNAYAGCGKTSTIELLAQAVPASTSALALAFNVKIKKALEGRLPANFTTCTLNGLGHSAWGRAIGRSMAVDDRKLGKAVTATAKNLREDLTPEDWGGVLCIAKRAMQIGLVPKASHGLVPDQPEVWSAIADECYVIPRDAPRLCDLASQALSLSISQSFAGLLSYDDQIYMPTLFGGKWERFPFVVVDERQDLSPLNHQQLKAVSTEQVVAVGDSKQAIYAFRGADTMDSLQEKLERSWLDLPLATTFRCPKAIVARCQEHAPGFTAWHTNPEGEIRSILDQPWSIGDILGEHASPNSLAVLCRNNAPLLRLAFKLIRKLIPCHMLGKDIGRGLGALTKKICPEDSTPIDLFAGKLRQWSEVQLSLARANEDDKKIESLTDRLDCIRAVLGSAPARSAGELRAVLADLFAGAGAGITLSTGHRAKGLEWPIVLHLDPWRIPARSALRRGGHELQQELNLEYVISTRTQGTLVLANLKDFEGD